MNAHCTATIVATQREQCIQVRICHTHYGHSKSIGHLKLSKEDRQHIAGKLAQGVTFERILDIRESVNSKFSRIHLTNKKYISNNQRAYGLRSVEKHNDDTLSVSAWVEEFNTKGQGNPVILYKPQGQTSADNCFNLTADDFILPIQTPLQQEILKKCAKSNIVCVDATHKTNEYYFRLITVLVIDKFGEGYPAAWCISNKEDTNVLVIFLRG